jgi:ketosteroid isomerase-like protein
MPAHSPEEIHALIAAAVNAGDLDASAELHEDAATVIVPPDGRGPTGTGRWRSRGAGRSSRAASRTGAGGSCSTTR